MNERKKAGFHQAVETVKKAKQEADAAQQLLAKVQGAKGLVDHAKGMPHRLKPPSTS